jgi:alkylation response protein AidB-like acyl-CoA dehydrogenase
MDLRESANERAFRAEVREWLEANLTGTFADARGLGGPGREHEAFEVRAEWERHLAAAGWTCLGWPVEHGGRGLDLRRQVIFHEEYARSDAPVRVGLIGEGMVGPTLIAFGTDEQKARLLPPIQRGEELWCQLYSEPNAGSDLANVATRAERDGDDYVINGQKVWTSLAHWSDWGFAIVRTEPGSKRHRGLSYLLVPMRQPGIEMRPIIQATGTSEFNEVFFDGARSSVTNLVGAEGDGWKIGMATLGFERGSLTLGQQIGFRRELERIMELARQTGAADDPTIRQRLSQAWIGVEIMRLNALRTLSTSGRDLERTASIGKLYWSTWHQQLGELAMDVLGTSSTVVAEPPYELRPEQSLFLFSRSDTIYAGSSEIQRNIIAERSLGLPKEPTGA